MCDITNQFNQPFITENNTVLFYNDNIIENIIQFLIHCKRHSLKIVRSFISICEGLYESLEYSEAKTIAGLMIVLYFTTLLTIHLFYSLAKKNNMNRILEEHIQYIRNN